MWIILSQENHLGFLVISGFCKLLGLLFAMDMLTTEKDLRDPQ